MDDMRFFHHYLTAGYPYLPDGCDTVWITEIPLLTHQHEFLMHAIISLGASHLSLVAMHLSLVAMAGSGLEEMHGYSTMLSHRGLALRGLQQSIDEHAHAGLPTASTMPNIPKLNAMFATCYALMTQSSHLRDGFTDFLILIRGSGPLTGHIAAITGLDRPQRPTPKPERGLRPAHAHALLTPDPHQQRRR
ncbi:hypothetical protein BDFG_06232 [Blastomyces dermatitidis ATCC 26199]|nr:hypothetical protein BDFG_06232 [Blastomyces dermatitidis ATCC 26199]